MFQLRIEAAPDALQLMQEGWPTRIISLVGDDLRFDLPKMAPHHFIARFHDVEAEVLGYVAPTAELLSSALASVTDLADEDRLLIQCHAGKSRSPAMALGVFVRAGMSPERAMRKVKSLRPFVIPNRLMVRLLDGLLNQRGELIRAVDRHYASLPADATLPDRGGLNV